MGLAWSAACAGDGFGLRSFGSGSHGRVPVKDAAATVADEEFALAKLIPYLRTDSHAAAHALLIVSAGKTGSTRGDETVKTGEPFGFNESTDRFALGVERFKLGVELLLAEGDAGADLLVGARESLYLCARLGERGFRGFRSFQTGELLVLKTVGLGCFKLDLVFDGRGLLGSLYGVELRAKARCFLAMLSDLSFEAGTESVFAAECV